MAYTEGISIVYLLNPVLSVFWAFFSFFSPKGVHSLENNNINPFHLTRMHLVGG